MRGGENSHGASSPAGITSINGRFVGADAFAIVAHYGNAIPAFARQYGTSCATCHIDFPKLKDFGSVQGCRFQSPQGRCGDAEDSARDAWSSGKPATLAKGNLAWPHSGNFTDWIALQQLSSVHQR